MDGYLMPGRRDFLGVSSAALAVAVAGRMSGYSRTVRAAAAATVLPAATIQAADKLFSAGHFAQADALYEQVLASDPGNSRALAQHGYVALLDGRLQEARTLLQRAVHAQPGNQQAAQNLAAACYRLNDFAAAAAAYRQVGSGSASILGPDCGPVLVPPSLAQLSSRLSYGPQPPASTRLAGSDSLMITLT